MIVLRVCMYMVVFATAFFFPLWVAVLVALIYALVYSPYELIIIGVCVDAQFGDITQEFTYLYTLCMVAVATSILLLRPVLSMYK